MTQQTTMGMNRTGMQMSPPDANDMQAGTPPSMTPATPGDDSALAAMRSSYIIEADPVGSVPLPATITGAITTSASMLTGGQPQLLLDKLGERLAFERTGTRLYDALITKFDALQDSSTSMTLADLQQIRQDEARHFAIVAEAITSIGGDPTSQTPCADVSGVESMGLMQVVTDPRTTIAQALHAVLVAELTDQAGWELLIVLAEDHGQNAMVTDFSLALTEERTHLTRVQQWFEEATLGVSISDGVSVDDVADASPSQQLH
jgi:rubrerythrin